MTKNIREKIKSIIHNCQEILEMDNYEKEHLTALRKQIKELEIDLPNNNHSKK